MPSHKNRLPSQKATVECLAARARSATLNHASSEVVDRIKKCLARANHANANENEAKSAIKMASKIMQQHNITQAQVMEGENDAQRLERGGLSTVKIGPRTQYRQVISETWVDDLATAICTFFDCDAFPEQFSFSIKWTFYGVAENTVSAAMAFEMTHNLVQSWAWPLHGVCARNSYCLGVAHGLKNIAKAEKRAAERAAKENEAKSTAAKTRPSSPHFQPPSMMKIDSAGFADGDDISEHCITSADNLMETDKGEHQSWASSMQLASYRQNVAKIAEDVLKANNIKLYAAGSLKRSVRDQKQYAQGVKDSSKINIRGARIENGRA